MVDNIKNCRKVFSRGSPQNGSSTGKGRRERDDEEITRTVMFVMANNVMWHSVGYRICNLNARRPHLLAASSGQANAEEEKSISGYALGPQKFGGTTIITSSTKNRINNRKRNSTRQKSQNKKQQQIEILRRLQQQRQKLLVKKMSSEVVLWNAKQSNKTKQNAAEATEEEEEQKLSTS